MPHIAAAAKPLFQADVDHQNGHSPRACVAAPASALTVAASCGTWFLAGCPQVLRRQRPVIGGHGGGLCSPQAKTGSGGTPPRPPNGRTPNWGAGDGQRCAAAVPFRCSRPPSPPAALRRFWVLLPSACGGGGGTAATVATTSWLLVDGVLAALWQASSSICAAATGRTRSVQLLPLTCGWLSAGAVVPAAGDRRSRRRSVLTAGEDWVRRHPTETPEREDAELGCGRRPEVRRRGAFPLLPPTVPAGCAAAVLGLAAICLRRRRRNGGNSGDHLLVVGRRGTGGAVASV